MTTISGSQLLIPALQAISVVELIEWVWPVRDGSPLTVMGFRMAQHAIEFYPQTWDDMRPPQSSRDDRQESLVI